jgi:hypothetical protein
VQVPIVNLYVSLAMGFSATQHSLRLFGAERTVFAREAITGINRVAYFLGKNIASLADLFILPFIFLSMFYSFSNPRGSFAHYLTLLVAAQWALSGIGYVISVVLDPAKAQLAAVVVALVLNGISGFSPTRSELSHFGLVCDVSYGFWLMEALFIIESARYPDIFQQTKIDIARKFSYDLHRSLWVHICVLAAIGLAARLLCLVVLSLVHRPRGNPQCQPFLSCWRRLLRRLRIGDDKYVCC